MMYIAIYPVGMTLANHMRIADESLGGIEYPVDERVCPLLASKSRDAHM